MPSSRARVAQPTGSRQNTVRFPSPLSKYIVVEDDDFEGNNGNNDAGALLDEDLSDEGDDLPDTAYSQEELTQGANTFDRSPSPLPTQTRTVFNYLGQNPPVIMIFLMSREDALVPGQRLIQRGLDLRPCIRGPRYAGIGRCVQAAEAYRHQRKKRRRKRSPPRESGEATASEINTCQQSRWGLISPCLLTQKGGRNGQFASPSGVNTQEHWTIDSARSDGLTSPDNRRVL
ncbi:hypothetical protein NMY22_g3354 [Coprinellus aureogranulatus]|nr:hypothetical protein NMY22_g3354 [Coprinellus aureogranulatus]